MSLFAMLAITIPLALVGLAIMAVALLRDRARGRARCPRCWYNMAASETGICPECGRPIRTPRDLRRTRRHWRCAGAGLAVLLLALGLAGRWTWLATRAGAGPSWRVTQSVTEGVLRVVVRKDTAGVVWTDQVIATHAGRTLLHQHIPHPTLHLDADGRLADITGNGMLNLVIETDTGGTGCCGTQHIYEYDPRDPALIPIAVLQGRGQWRDLDTDGLPEFVVGDDSFNYRWTSGAESPYPRVILRWHDDRYAVALDLMRAPAPDAEQIEAWITAAPTDGIGMTLQRALGMVYSGHADLGWDFLARANAGVWSQPELVDSVQAAFEDSPYAADILRLNREQAE